ncbi:MAG: type II toxin-antitoxin system VapC family toxin [Acidobacteriaceae bacterium]|nr:type II toxin-antitoxin system VapC family toxin [Acidobacteriaceae bacterium]
MAGLCWAHKKNLRKPGITGRGFGYSRTGPLLSIYADTSFFVSLYLPDVHSAEAHRRVRGRPSLWLTPLHRAEWAHAVYQHVFHGKISAQEARRVYREFEGDRKARLWVEIAVPDVVFERCCDLARRHVPRLGVRTLDTLHVACALELKAERFWTFDERQARLAEAERLKTS